MFCFIGICSKGGDNCQRQAEEYVCRLINKVYLAKKTQDEVESRAKEKIYNLNAKKMMCFRYCVCVTGRCKICTENNFSNNVIAKTTISQMFFRRYIKKTLFSQYYSRPRLSRWTERFLEKLCTLGNCVYRNVNKLYKTLKLDIDGIF